MTKQSLILFAVVSLAIGASLPASAESAFYGGVSLRDPNTNATGGLKGDLPLTWTQFAAPIADDTVQRTMAYGGYRWRNDVAVEAAFNTGDKYSLQPRLGGAGGGVGLAAPNPSAHTWNADVYTSWEFVRSVSLYGRLGYAQTETRPLFAGASLVPGDLRRQREGVNYGVGLRYDMTQSLGLRVEYARFNRFVGEGANTGPLPESDQVMIGVQFKF